MIGSFDFFEFLPEIVRCDPSFYVNVHPSGGVQVSDETDRSEHSAAE